MKRTFAILILAVFSAHLRANLPESVINACLAPGAYEDVSGQQWALMSADTWENAAVRITETPTASITTQDVFPHPQGWLEGEISVIQFADGAEIPPHEQRLSLTLQAKNVVPKVTLSLYFLNGARLPPCAIVTHQGKLTIVSNRKDWYIIAEDPAMTITQTDEEHPRTTLTLPAQTLEKSGRLSASIRVGEGALP